MQTETRTTGSCLISIIIPVLNEGERLAATLSSIGEQPGVETIVVDGGSVDDSVAIAKRMGAEVLSCEKGRARQLNHGAEKARGDVLLFLHGDTRLPGAFARDVLAAMAHKDTVAGAFTLAIDSRQKKMRCVAYLANLRARFFQLPYGDQAIFVRAGMFHQVGGYADLPIMEDFCLVRRLKKKGRIVLLDRPVITSGRRWRKLGVVKTTLINQIVVGGFLLGVSPELLGRIYRGGEKR